MKDTIDSTKNVGNGTSVRTVNTVKKTVIYFANYRCYQEQKNSLSLFFNLLMYSFHKYLLSSHSRIDTG